MMASALVPINYFIINNNNNNNANIFIGNCFLAITRAYDYNKTHPYIVNYNV